MKEIAPRARATTCDNASLGLAAGGCGTALLGIVFTAYFLAPAIGTLWTIVLTSALATCAVLLFVVVALSLRASRTNAQADSDPDAANPAKTPPGKYAANLPSTSYEEDPSSNATDVSSSTTSQVSTNPEQVVTQASSNAATSEILSSQPTSTEISSSSEPQITEPQVLEAAKISKENTPPISQSTSSLHVENPSSNVIDASSSTTSQVSTNPEQVVTQASSNAATSEILSSQPTSTEISSSSEPQITEPQVLEAAKISKENTPPISQSTSSHVENPSSNVIDASSSNQQSASSELVVDNGTITTEESKQPSSEEHQPAPVVRKFCSTLPVAELPNVIEPITGSTDDANEDATVLNLIHSVLGNDFDKFNYKAAIIDFSRVPVKLEPVYRDRFIGSGQEMPEALLNFCFACHPDAQRENRCAALVDNPMTLPSNTEQSMYIRQGIDASIVGHLIPESETGSYLFVSSIWGDTSCIIPRSDDPKGTGCGYYVCCNPFFLAETEMRPSAANFCQALAREMKNSPALIVDVSGDNEDYIRHWVDGAGTGSLPAAGVVDNLQNELLIETTTRKMSREGLFGYKIEEELTLSLQSFQLHEKDSKGQAIDNTSYRLTVNGWKDNTNIGPEDMQWLIGTIHAIVEKYGILAQVIHCSSGCGRAPTLALRSMVADVARKAKEQEIPCCFANECNEQLQPSVNGQLNLAYVLRNAALSLVFSRGVAGWGGAQYRGDLKYAQFLAAQ